MMPVRASSRIDRVMLVLASIAVLWTFQLHLRMTHVDYNTFHRAGTALLEGRWSDLYTPGQSSMGGFLYPLGSAFVFALFSSLGEFAGRVAFYGVLVLCLAWTLKWCHEFLGQPRETERALWITLLLGMRSINDSWISGNITLLLLALSLLAFRFYEQSTSAQRLNRAAASLGLAISFKLLPAVMGAYWTWKRDWRFLVRLAAWTTLLYLVPYAIAATAMGGAAPAWNLATSWMAALQDPANFGSHEMVHFQNIPATLHRAASALGWSHGWVTPTLLLIAGALTLLPAMRGPRKQTYAAEDFAILLAWIPLLSPVTWHHVGVFYLPLIYRTATEKSASARASLVLFLVFYTLTGRNMLGPERHAWVSTHSIPLIGILAMVLPATRKIFRSASAAA